MGTTYFAANCSKRQYFDPDHVGGSENTKQSGILWGLSGHALGLLLMPDYPLDFHLESWLGDALVLVGDEGEPNTISRLEPFQTESNQSAYEIVTQRFDDITLNLIALLCKRQILMEHFLNEADQHKRVFVNLAHIIIHLQGSQLEREFISRFGDDWRRRYKEAIDSEPWHYPMPMIPRTKSHS